MAACHTSGKQHKRKAQRNNKNKQTKKTKKNKEKHGNSPNDALTSLVAPSLSTDMTTLNINKFYRHQKNFLKKLKKKQLTVPAKSTRCLEHRHDKSQHKYTHTHTHTHTKCGNSPYKRKAYDALTSRVAPSLNTDMQSRKSSNDIRP